MTTIRAVSMVRRFAFSCGAVVTLAVATSSPAQVVTMTDGASSALVNVGSGAGMYNWSVSGQNQLNQQWFWYRVGSSQAQPINQLGGLSYNQSSANTLDTTYNNGSFNVTISYSLTDAGGGQSDIAENIHIINPSANTLNLTFYQYSDFNLGGTPNGDTVSIDNANAIQQKGATAIVEGIIDPLANEFEANTTGGNTSTLYLLGNTPSGYVLNDNGYSAGDVTWAFEWDLSLAPGTDVNILKDKILSVQVIPEPSTLALTLLGLIGTCLRLAKRRSV